MRTIDFDKVKEATFKDSKKVKRGTLTKDDNSSVNVILLRNNKITCICYQKGCPPQLSGNKCGTLTQSCGVGAATAGAFVVERTLSIDTGQKFCNNLTITVNFDFGFAPDEVTFFAVLADGSETGVGSTGCTSGIGSAVFVLPSNTVAIRTVTIFACSGPQLNSSIDKFDVICSSS